MDVIIPFAIGLHQSSGYFYMSTWINLCHSDTMTIAAAVTMETIVLGRDGALYRFPAANFHNETGLLDYH